jgi:hypothetical protein
MKNWFRKHVLYCESPNDNVKCLLRFQCRAEDACMRANYKKWVGGEYLDQIRETSSSGVIREHIPRSESWLIL